MSKSYIKSLLVVGVTALFASAGCGAQIMDNGPTSSCQVASDCSPTQNCVSGTCVAKTPVNPPECKGDDGCKGKPGTICHKGACVTATECDAGRPCADPTKQFCDNGYCRQIESCASNPEICGDGRICVKNECLATTGCMGSDECKPTERCKEGACIDITGKTDLCKLGFLSCGAGYRCEFNNCVPNCNDPCGGKCCGTAEVCYKDTCVMPCGTGEEMCGTAAAPVCCNTSTHGCFGGQCKPLGVACDESAGKYCTIVRYCDAKYASCVKYEDATDLCLLPTVNKFEAEVKLYFNSSKVLPTSLDVMSAPSVADVTGPTGALDGKPDIIFATYDNDDLSKAALRVIAGTAGSKGKTDVTEYWTSSNLPTDPMFGDPLRHMEPFRPVPATGTAVGDLDDDGIPEIVLETRSPSAAVRAVRGTDGATLWVRDGISRSYGSMAALAIADLDHDGHPEVLWNNLVLNGQNGTVLCTLPTSNMTPVAADLDETGNMEIIHGGQTYSFVRNGATAACSLRFSPKVSGGNQAFAAVGDIYESIPGPELAVIADGHLYILDSSGKEIWQYTLPGGSAGPPTLGDFDGDEKLEVAFADADYYIIVKPLYDKATKTYSAREMWRNKTQDHSSGMTGSSIFDFDGDGKAEAVYFDETHLRIYDGETGNLKLETPNSTNTWIEFPVIVDIDGDGHADIVTVANKSGNHGPYRGVRVITDKHNRWVPTRKIWNQHTYHYTNVNDDGTIPQNEKHHWKEAWSNTFRQNVQKGNNRLAPDITVKFASLFGASCNASTQRTLRYTIRNEGDKEVAAGAITNVLSVRKTGTTTYDVLDSRTNTQKLAPGDSELVTFDWNIPTKYQSSNLDFKVEADHGNAIIECREDNTAENLNVAVASPNLSVNLNQSFACFASSSGFSTPINFELSNSGAVAVPAGKAEVTIQFKKSDGTVVKEVKIKNTEEIPAQGYINMNSTVDFSLSSSSNIISLDLVISVKLDPSITECSEADNEISKAGAVICYSFG